MSSAPDVRLVRPTQPRSPAERHRVATPLELLTDLCFVVAIGQAGLQLHHSLVAAHPGYAVLLFAMGFFAIWWAWINFAFYASAYDNDDVVYRLLIILQIVGVLVLAAGIPALFEGSFRVVAVGYAIMRVALVLLWVRAYRADLERRPTIRRYIGGIIVSQVLWLSYAFTFPAGSSLTLPVYGLLVLIDVSVPIVAERAGGTPWHPHHIAERFGLFFIIVLGETILAATTALIAVFGQDRTERLAPVVLLMVAAVLIVFSMWWTYFEHDSAEALAGQGGAFTWAYAHYVIYAAAAAVGAGIAARTEYLLHPEEVSGVVTAAAITIPIALFILSTWAMHRRVGVAGRGSTASALASSALTLVATVTPVPELLTAVALVALLVAQLVGRQAELRAGPPERA